MSARPEIAPRPDPFAESGLSLSLSTFPEAPLCKKSPEEDRIAFFLDLFHGRRDVYAERFESQRTGKSGFQPVCANLWKRPLCQKPKTKCHQCPHRILVPLSENVIRRHLAGDTTVGMYPMLPAETCRLLAVDFDKGSWQEDVLAFLAVCRSRGVPAALERSRSGKGGHVWVFFGREVAARTARQMGAALITETMATRPSMGLDSYDRLFPNQDNMPKGGFGNLIAIPLQRGPAQNGNSLFVDDGLRVYSDQWAFLSTLQRMPIDRVQQLAQEARDGGRIIGVRPVALNEVEEDPWTLPPSRKTRVVREANDGVPSAIRVVLSDEIYVPKAGLPPSLLNEVVRVAAFQNPEFYRAQGMRLPVYGKPRVVGCASDTGEHIGLPRGCLDDLESLMSAWGVELSVEDRRFVGDNIDVCFEGELRPSQTLAAKALRKHDFGVLAASTAFGKTVVAIHMLACRGVNTLILVHRRQLMDQWIERLAMFLDVDRKQIGCIGGGKRKATGIVDVAVMQSLCRKGEVDDLVADYGQVIVDECHHVSARSFELIARRCRPRYVLGLSATVTRKDGHHPIIFMQCGPVRFRTSDKDEAARRPFSHAVEVVRTGYRLTVNESEVEGMGIQEVFRCLIEDEGRNLLIAEKALSAMADGRSPVLLTERKKHLEWFRDYLSEKVDCLIVLHGGMGVKQRRAAWEALKETSKSGAPRLVLATGKYLGEGFDDARLDTLLLAMPVSWKGTVAQYAGRLHRLFADKRTVTIYDFLDDSVPVLGRMFERRKKGYAAIGYAIQDENDVFDHAGQSSLGLDGGAMPLRS
ncbi:MAG: DEAD/DEAH box helicase family protein [Kiritimatiellia bacterium]|nr:DEAD/DEAH box helicase family protein [Kiritimatiellia bacterium]MDP6810446.1 DEAD/DEAH box helicase family protein [Kiritimatiellia bacterium]MDP7024533.1 DEAD/DEAH box helicase family protein [Kiritimatiellia bacterium]